MMEKQTRIEKLNKIIKELSLDDQNVLIEILDGLTETMILISETEIEHRECERALGYAQKILIQLINVNNNS